MNVVSSIFRDFTRFFNIKTRKGLIRAVIALILIVVAVQFMLSRDVSSTEAEPLPPTVLVGTAQTLLQNDSFSLVGSVEAKNQARIQTEAGGRVVRVPVALGDELTAGSIIAQLENDSQYASLLQAEGSYEAALAAAAQSDVSVADAQNDLASSKNNALNVYRNAYNTTNSAVLTDIDTFFSNPQNTNFGVTIDAQGQAITLVQQRKAIGTLLTNWQASVQTATAESDLTNLLLEASQSVNTVITQVDSFIQLTSTANPNETLNGIAVRDYTENLINLRTSLNSTLNSIASAQTALTTAADALRRAEIGGTNNTQISAANAQVKQALGALRAAQANYNKTIIRTPISGTLNELSLKAGDYVSIGAPVALVANNNALEITTFVGERDAERMSIGQSVLIEGKTEGVVTAIAPGIDSITKKTEVKIATETDTLQTGDTVTITFPRTASETVSNNGPILIPITAVKFTATDGSIFTVEDSTLVSRPVTIGPIVGSFVTIESGLERTEAFVIDARGLTEGTEVEAITN